MKRQKRYSTGFLFSTPSLFSGAGTVMNLAGNYYEFNSSDSGFEADCIALQNDFKMVGQDINDAIQKIKDEGQRLNLVK